MARSSHQIDILSHSGWMGPVYDEALCEPKLLAHADELLALGRRCGKTLLTWDFICLVEEWIAKGVCNE